MSIPPRPPQQYEDFMRHVFEHGVRKILKAGAIPVVLGGDHSVNIPCINAFDDQDPIHIVQIDAHLDFVDERHGVRFGHGNPMRRAAEKEGDGAAHAMNAWQRQCQKAWLAHTRPAVVAWPWENHGWERDFCRQARRLGVTTLGYQHTVIGPHQLNYSPATNKDGLDSLSITRLGLIQLA